MGVTSIEWADHSINPIRARNIATGAVGHFCEKISPGCAACYASAWNERVRPSGKHLIGTGLAFISANRSDVEVFLDTEKLSEVLRRRKPTRYFWCDMSDLFGEWVPEDTIDHCFAVMALTPQHTHLVLTKRAAAMRDHCRQASTIENVYAIACQHREAIADRWQWPLPNVWLGVSVENQHFADERIPLLLDTPAAVRFVSAEPLLASVDFYAFLDTTERNECLGILGGHQGVPGLDWVIVGGESGRGARPIDVAWARSIVAQCKAAGVAVFVKQLGAKPIGVRSRTELAAGAGVECEHGYDVCPTCDAGTIPVKLRDKKGGDMAEWPEDLRVRDFPSSVREAQ